jgi:Putative Ig domain
MAIDSGTGRITWAPTIPQIGTYNNIQVTVTDPYGNSASQKFSVTVQADTTPLAVSLQLSANPIHGAGGEPAAGDHVDAAFASTEKQPVQLCRGGQRSAR